MKVTSVHHKLPSSFGWYRHPENLVRLQDHIHQSIHIIFLNDTPIKRIRRLIEADKSTMRPEVYNAISDVLKQFEGIIEIEAYKPYLFNHNKFKWITRNSTKNT